MKTFGGIVLAIIGGLLALLGGGCTLTWLVLILTYPPTAPDVTSILLWFAISVGALVAGVFLVRAAIR
ncbi:MAG: hypothetical protein ACRETL_14285, partial [Gammaproteobacteria bacterium]